LGVAIFVAVFVFSAALQFYANTHLVVLMGLSGYLLSWITMQAPYSVILAALTALSAVFFGNSKKRISAPVQAARVFAFLTVFALINFIPETYPVESWHARFAVFKFLFAGIR
jgi:hypothetical protein